MNTFLYALAFILIYGGAAITATDSLKVLLRLFGLFLVAVSFFIYVILPQIVEKREAVKKPQIE